MSVVADVNTTSITDAIRLGCRTMQRVFNADDDDRPFFKSVVYPEAFLAFHPGHGECHVPGRHLNALLNAQDVINVDLAESAIEKHRRAAFFSYSGPVALALNRQVVEGPLINFNAHNLREGMHALYALVKYRDDDQAFEMAQRCIAAVFDLWSAERGWDAPRLQRLGLNYMVSPDFVAGEARMIGPLVKLYRVTGYAPALELALVFKEKAICEFYLADGAYHTERFTTTHSHSITCVMSSLAQLADLLDDVSLLLRVKAFYDNGLWRMRDQLGWSPERALAENIDDGEMNNTGDILETALILGRYGFSQYYEDAERILRCHMLPSQLRDVSFIRQPPNPDSVDGLHDVADRHLGAFGFPAPYGHQSLGDGRHMMSFNMDVVGGTVGSLCEAYREVARVDAAGHRLNLLFDHQDECIVVRSPYTHDTLEVELASAGSLSVRLPSWVEADELRIEGIDAAPQPSNGYLFFARPPVGVPIRISFPLAPQELTLSESIHVRPIRVRLRGDTVEAMDDFGCDLTFFDPIGSTDPIGLPYHRCGMIAEQLEFFAANGYVVVPEALTPEQVRTINDIVDRDLEAHPTLWRGDQTSRNQAVNILLTNPELDFTMRPVSVLPLMEAIMGPDLGADEHSIMIRAANPDGPTECDWHRDAGGGVQDPPYYTRYLSIVFYLNDVDDTTHTFSILPGSAQMEKPVPREQCDLSSAIHLTGAAGTAILFNAYTLHAGNVRITDSERRTIHLYCGRTTDQHISDLTIFPPRLWEGKDGATRKFYSRRNDISRVLATQFSQ